MNTKYKILLNEKNFFGGHTLYRIVALRDFGFVEKGELGGYVESEGNLAEEGNCWVAHEAKIYGKAYVCDNAMITDYAEVSDSSVVSGNAQVSGFAKVRDNAIISNDARVIGDAQVGGFASIDLNALVCGQARIEDYAYVTDQAVVKGSAYVGGPIVLGGETIVSADAVLKAQYDCLSINGLGSRQRTTTFFLTKNGTIRVNCGCFSGTIEEFRKQVKLTHGGIRHETAYLAATNFAEELLKGRENA